MDPYPQEKNEPAHVIFLASFKIDKLDPAPPPIHCKIS